MEKKASADRFQVSFPSNMVEEPIMHRLSTKLHVIPNILRGRITATSAKLELELSGKAGDIKKAVKFLESRGVNVKRLS